MVEADFFHLVLIIRKYWVLFLGSIVNGGKAALG